MHPENQEKSLFFTYSDLLEYEKRGSLFCMYCSVYEIIMSLYIIEG